jgi:hypothetical protein
MLITILKIRLLQTLRIIQSIGILRMCIFLLCAVPFLIRYFAESWYLWIVSTLFLGLVQFMRTDKKFLQIAQLSVYQVFAIEYTCLLAPVWLALLLKNEYLLLVGSVLSAVVLAVIPFTFQTQNRPLIFVSRWIPAVCFEWKSGFRQHFPFVLILLILGVTMASYEIAIPLVMMSFSLLTACFYLEGESIEMLKVFAKSPQKFILYKIGWQLGLFWGFMLPLVLTFGVLHTQYVYILLYLLLTTSLAQSFAILYKYAVYQPNAQNQINVFIYVVFGLAFMLVIVTPFLVPVGIAIMVVYYRKSIKRLAMYL